MARSSVEVIIPSAWHDLLRYKKALTSTEEVRAL